MLDSSKHVSLFAAALVGLSGKEVPDASITRIALQIGGSFGIAILAVVLDSGRLNSRGGGDASVAVFNQAFWWSIGLNALAVVLTLGLPNRPRTPREHAQGGGQREGMWRDRRRASL